MNVYIEMRGVGHDYGEVRAVEQIDITVAENELACIIGPSGCGKSTLLHIASGLLRPTRGSVRVGGVPLYGPGEPPRVGYVFQEPRLLNWRTVEQNLALTLQASGVPRQRRTDRIERHLEMIGLLSHRNAWPLHLSGGQRQRVSIARALVIDPEYLVMDEPFSTLDEMTARVMRQELLGIAESLRKTILFVTHSILEAIFLADRIHFLTPGPARKFKEMRVPLPKPRDYEDPELYALEGEITREMLSAWGFHNRFRARREAGQTAGERP